MVQVTYVSALRLALDRALTESPQTIMLGEDIGAYGGVFKITSGLQARHGAARVRDTPISEAAFVGVALGAAMSGYRPIVELMYVDFSLVAMDQLVNQVAKVRYMTGGQFKCPMTVLTQGGAGKGNAAQHSQSLEALFTHVPGLKVACPSTPGDAYRLLLSATRDDEPTVVIAHKLLFGTADEFDVPRSIEPLGHASVRRAGTDVTIVAWSAMVREALRAAESLAPRGIEAEVLDLRTLRPLDLELILASVRKTARCIVVQEAPLTGGFGAEIAALVAEHAFDDLDAPVCRVAGEEIPIPYAANLEAEAIPGVDKIAATIERIVAA